MTDHEAIYQEVVGPIDARTFREQISKGRSLLSDKTCPAEIKVKIGNWFFRKIKTNYRIPDEATRMEIAQPLLPAIRRIKSMPLKGLYLNYTDVKATSLLAKAFWKKRFPEKDFVLQLVNDQQLIRNYLQDPEIDDETLVAHFLQWASRTEEETQKSNILDVLLRFYAKDERVVDYYDKLKFAQNTTRNLYTDAQSVHDDEITASALRAAEALLDWAADHPVPPAEMMACEGDPLEWILRQLPTDIFGEGSFTSIGAQVTGKAKSTRPDYLQAVFNRLSIDNSVFGDTAFNMTVIAVATVRYISLIEDPGERRGRWEMLNEEMKGMAKLCASRFVTQFIIVLQGCEEAFNVTISEAKRLHAIISTKFGLLLNAAPEEVIEGSYIPALADKYASACESYINGILARIENVEEADLEANVVNIVEDVTGLKGWTYANRRVTRTPEVELEVGSEVGFEEY